jgi:hypothetical protein
VIGVPGRRVLFAGVVVLQTQSKNLHLATLAHAYQLKHDTTNF